MHHITCHYLALSLVSDSLRLLSLGTRWSAKERSTRCSDAPWMIRWAATSWPSRHWQPTQATTIKGSRNLRSWSLFRPTASAPSPRPSGLRGRKSTSSPLVLLLLYYDTTTADNTTTTDHQLSSNLGARYYVSFIIINIVYSDFLRESSSNYLLSLTPLAQLTPTTHLTWPAVTVNK